MGTFGIWKTGRRAEVVEAGDSTAVALLLKIKNMKKKIDKLKHINQVHNNKLEIFAKLLHKRPYSNHWTLHSLVFLLDVFYDQGIVLSG